jgi:thiopeptide-type bacteriocin biosynthesis protein
MVVSMKNTIWLSAHLHFDEAPSLTPFLVSHLWPWLQQQQQDDSLKRFFFIRYGEGGPHVRLRLLVEEVQMATWRARVSQLAQDTAKSGLENHVIWLPYEPELLRYGGHDAIHWAEAQFEASTIAVLEQLSEHQPVSYDQLTLLALQLHTVMAAGFGISTQEAAVLFKRTMMQWLPFALKLFCEAEAIAPDQAAEEKLLDRFENMYLAQAEGIQNFIVEIWQQPQLLETWFKRNQLIFQKLLELQLQLATKEASLSRAAWPVFSSYIHMTHNRLGLANEDEAYIGYLLWRVLENMS